MMKFVISLGGNGRRLVAERVLRKGDHLNPMKRIAR
jgi:hypothetical protein